MAVWQFKFVYGGVAEGDSIDRDATFRIGKNINYRRQHDVITLTQRMNKDSGTVVDALPKWITDLQGTPYAYLANGNILERVATASWAIQATMPASVGQGFATDPSFLYFANSSFVGQFPVGASWATQASQSWQAITGSSWNPIKYFAAVDLLLVGNDGELAVYDYGAANFSSSRLTMPRGWHVRDIEEWGDYVAISLWTGNNIRQSSEGKMVLWDGLSDTFNAIVDSEEGNMLMTIKDGFHLNVLTGVIGNIYRYESGQFNQKRKIPFVNEDRGNWMDLFPGSKALWRGIPHIGVAGEGDTNASFLRGIYSWGTNRNNIPNSLNLEYEASEAPAEDPNTKIGALHVAANNEFYAGWANASAFGIDLMSTTQAQASGFIDSIAFIGSARETTYEKQIQQMRAFFKPLPVGSGISLKIRADYSPSWATVFTANTSGQVFESTRQILNASGIASPFPRGRALHLRAELSANASGIAPELLEVRTVYDAKPAS